MPEDSECDDMWASSVERVHAVVLDFIDQLPAFPPSLQRVALDTSPVRSPAFRRWAGFTSADVDRVSSDLGEHAVLGATMASFACDVFRRLNAFATTGCEMRRFWRHALTVASAMDRLGDRANVEDDPSIYHAAGLFHDVGKLVLNSCMPKAYARIVQESTVRRVAIHRVEVAHLGLDHASVGSGLLDHWRMPSDMRDAVAGHHHPTTESPCRTKVTRISSALQLAELIACDSAQVGSTGASQAMTQRLCDRLGIEHAAIAELRREINDRVADTETAFAEVVYGERRSSIAAAFPSWGGCGPGERSSWFDDRARRWFAALADLATEAMHCGRATDLCRLIADRVGELLGVDAMVAFIANEDATVLRCGVRDRSRLFSTTVLLDSAIGSRVGPSTAQHDAALFSRAPMPARPPFIPPNRVADSVRDRFRMVFDGASQVMLPFCSGGQTVGGVLIDSASTVGHGILNVAEASGFLVAVLNSSVSRMIESERAERARQALASANLSLQDRVFQRSESRTLATIAELAAGAAHEMNTPLAVISGRAQLLAGQAGDSRQRSELETIDDHAKQCSRIISELVEFAKPPAPKPALVILRTWFATARDRWLKEHPSLRSRLTIGVSDTTPTVWCDGDQLAAILDAIVSNAAAAVSSQKGVVQINSACGASDDIVVMSIADDGCGMSPEVLAHACDPFYSHRAAGRGRGLGLSTARRLAENNGGELRIESQERVGTTVHVELPSRAPG